MVVKKHLMKKDAQGALIDSDEAEEGWPIYIVREEQFKKITLPERALVFMAGTRRFFYYENGKLSDENLITSEPEQNLLAKIYLLERTPEGKLLQNNANMPLICRFTKKICKLFKLQDHFSPEFVLALKLTEHYNEFAEFFPELGRLRELAKMTALIRIFQVKRQENLQAIEELKRRQTADTPVWEYTLLGAALHYRGKIEAAFKKIHLNSKPVAASMNEQRFWVPASMYHYGSFFTYGGVHVCPEIRQVQNGNWERLGITNVLAGSACSSSNLAKEALDAKMRALDHASRNAVKIEERPDGTKVYYGPERPANKPGLPTRGAAQVTAHNPKTGDVWIWMECYNQQGAANRVHPKAFNGVRYPDAPHFPQTQREAQSQARA